MNTITKRAHTECLSEVVELVTLASLLGLIADTLWVSVDAFSNGWKCHYYFIFGMLFISTTITATAFYKYHMNNFRATRRIMLRDSLKCAKAKYKRK